MLQYRNTPDRDTKLSPAMCIFGRPIRDFIPIMPGRFQPHSTWRNTLHAWEEALRNRHMKAAERWAEHTRQLPPLVMGDTVRIQNQTGPYPNKWDKTGRVIEVRQFDQYVVRVDGSGRVTLRNRKFLRKFEPVIPSPPPMDDLLYHVPQPRSLPPSTSRLAPPKPAQDSPVLSRPVATSPSHDDRDRPATDPVNPAPLAMPDMDDDHQSLGPPSPGNGDAPLTDSSPPPPVPVPDGVTQDKPTALHCGPSVPHMVQRLLPHNSPGTREQPLEFHPTVPTANTQPSPMRRRSSRLRDAKP